ncbi:MAG: glycosyltransferase family 2 protein [Hyphomicrobiales bacterium]|nr:glycosyltransferase family 2 protein [Hyphomicrobiales bacterium]
MTPRISIVVPTKDRPRLLVRALRSALAQEGPPFEIVVVDDGDGEGLEAARDIGDPRVVALSSGKAGQVGARNLGFAAARGERLAFLDDDDWWAGPDHLARLDAALDAPGLAFADGAIVREDEEGRAVGSLPFEAAADPATLARDNLLLVSGVLFDASWRKRLGPFDAGLPYYWDWDWYLRLAAAGAAFRHSGGDAVRISARASSVSSATNAGVRARDLARLCVKHGLTGIVLRNHESIAADRAAGR